MALAFYQTLTNALIQAPSSPVPLISAAALNSYINLARNQVAGDAECIRLPSALTLTNAVAGYGFSAITNTSTVQGVNTVIAVRSARIGSIPIDIRNWEWFAQYYLGNAAIGQPTIAAQQGQGVSGTLYFNPTPGGTFFVSLDAVWLPIGLVDDTTAEAIPALWTDAIPFYAAWLALQSLQRQADADMMMQRYQSLVRRGREMATPTELPENLPGGAGAVTAAAHQTVAAPPAAGGR